MGQGWLKIIIKNPLKEGFERIFWWKSGMCPANIAWLIACRLTNWVVEIKGADIFLQNGFLLAGLQVFDGASGICEFFTAYDNGVANIFLFGVFELFIEFGLFVVEFGGDAI